MDKPLPASLHAIFADKMSKIMDTARNPLTGYHCSGYRFRFHVRSIANHAIFLPLEMKNLPQILQLRQGVDPLAVFACNSPQSALNAFDDLRRKYDFDFWAVSQYFIRDMDSPDSIIPLRLNDAQFHVIDILRKRYFHKEVGRYIVTKSFRRCGLSTCIQAYILWMQTCRMRNHSYTCGPNDISLLPLKADLCRFLKRKGVPHGMGIRLANSDRRAFFNTFRNPDAIRGIDLNYIHFSDMSRWKAKESKAPSRAFKASVSAVLFEFSTLIVLEGNIPSNQNHFFKTHVTVARSSKDPYFFSIHIPESLSPARFIHG